MNTLLEAVHGKGSGLQPSPILFHFMPDGFLWRFLVVVPTTGFSVGHFFFSGGPNCLSVQWCRQQKPIANCPSVRLDF